MVAKAHTLIAGKHPGLLTIIVPRHPERGPELAAALAARGHAVARRRAGEPIAPSVDIYVADTLGELGLFYRVAPVAFIGGSLVKHGGQNPIEPISLGAAVLHGPHVHNFADIYAALGDAMASYRVEDARALAATAGALLADPATCKKSVAGARAALKPFSGALTATWKALRPYLGGDSPGAAGRVESLEPSRP
jgi:3-deoxy-D-manno-octulosonic-acid transferase